MSDIENKDKRLTLPYEAPQIADTIAASLGGSTYRLGRDGTKAAELWAAKPYAADGLFLALKLLGWLNKNSMKLKELMALLPDYHTAESEYSVNTNSARLLRSLTRTYQSELVSGLRVRDGRGSARIVYDGKRLKILAESYSMEAAWDLCSEIKAKAAEADKANK
jgi:phosphomannomutase